MNRWPAGAPSARVRPRRPSAPPRAAQQLLRRRDRGARASPSTLRWRAARPPSSSSGPFRTSTPPGAGKGCRCSTRSRSAATDPGGPAIGPSSCCRGLLPRLDPSCAAPAPDRVHQPRTGRPDPSPPRDHRAVGTGCRAGRSRGADRAAHGVGGLTEPRGRCASYSTELHHSLRCVQRASGAFGVPSGAGRAVSRRLLRSVPRTRAPRGARVAAAVAPERRNRPRTRSRGSPTCRAARARRNRGSGR